MPPKNRKLNEEDKAEIRRVVRRTIGDVPVNVLRILSLKPSRRDAEWAGIFAAQHPAWPTEFIDFAVDEAESLRSSTLDQVVQELIEARDTLAELGQFSGQLLHELEERLDKVRSESTRSAAASAASASEF